MNMDIDPWTRDLPIAHLIHILKYSAWDDDDGNALHFPTLARRIESMTTVIDAAKAMETAGMGFDTREKFNAALAKLEPPYPKP